MEIGSYSDATILFRSLVESFICFKFYIINKDGNGISKYVLRQSGRSIKDIFEVVVPGYYNSLYAQLCNFTHGNPLVQALFRGNVSNENPIETNINNINIEYFSYVSNQLLPLIIGTIELFKIVFPNNTIEKEKLLVKELESIYHFIKKDISDRKLKYPNQIEMINYYNKIIEIRN